MRFLALSLLIASIALSLCACGGGSGPFSSTPQAKPSPLSFPLPDPQNLPPLSVEPRQSSYTEGDLVKLGKDFDGALASDNVVVNGNAVEFHASWGPGQGVSGLGYCIYTFNIAGYDRNPEINTTWSVDPTDTDSVYFALANWGENRWDWFTADANPLTLASFTPYISGTDDFALAVAVIDSGTPALDKIQLGPPPVDNNWLHTWGGTDDEEFSSVATNGTDALYCSGLVFGYGAGASDALIVSYDLEGNLNWARAWGGTVEDNYVDVAVAPDGQVYAAGDTASFGEGNSDVLIQGWSENGFLSWTRTWGTAEDEHVMAMANSGDILYILATTNQVGTGEDLVLIKFDALAKSILWKKYFGLGFDDPSGSLVVTHPSEGVDVVHVAFNLGIAPSETEAAYCEFDGSGAITLQKQWDNPTYAISVVDLTVTGTPQVFITGSAETDSMGRDALLLEYSSEPTYIAQGWTLNSSDQFYGRALGVDDSGDLLLTGRDSNAGPFPGGFLAKISPEGTALSGNLLVNDSIGGQLYDLAYLSGYGAFVVGDYEHASETAWQSATLSSRALTGTWADVILNTDNIAGTLSPVTTGTVTQITDAVVDDGGGGDDAAVGLFAAP